jgi:hypothetical protein
MDLKVLEAYAELKDNLRIAKEEIETLKVELFKAKKANEDTYRVYDLKHLFWEYQGSIHLTAKYQEELLNWLNEEGPFPSPREGE